jgi:hypothetical protein
MVSPRYPMPLLHLKHSHPRNNCVLWLWSSCTGPGLPQHSQYSDSMRVGPVGQALRLEKRLALSLPLRAFLVCQFFVVIRRLSIASGVLQQATQCPDGYRKDMCPCLHGLPVKYILQSAGQALFASSRICLFIHEFTTFQRCFWVAHFGTESFTAATSSTKPGGDVRRGLSAQKHPIAQCLPRAPCSCP